MIDSDKIIAEDYKWVFENEPTFNINGNILTGKVGRSPNGDSILISMTVPEFFPIIRPEVKVITSISHPNIDEQMNLSLQILDEWDPIYRLKDIIANVRRLFIKSKASIKDKSRIIQIQSSNLEEEILNLQKQISEINKTITEVKNNKLEQSGIIKSTTHKVTENSMLNSNLLALEDLLELLEIKFEEAEIDQTDFFRLYRRYIKERYICASKLNSFEVKKNDISEQKTKRPIRH